jgi:predicted RNA-binding protein (virulence factor B family)
VDISIGIANSPRELSFETEQTAAEVQGVVTSALESGAKFFSLKDSKGRVFVIPTETFTYMEVGSETSRKVGFVA